MKNFLSLPDCAEKLRCLSLMRTKRDTVRVIGRTSS
ncbi:hypothetical protein EVA_03370 [gut metagenome]|uniref:Uncharacterized protein n=1 Tax=gut metagenome TaxID=749906 RepID=J9GM14_9ZZZZ